MTHSILTELDALVGRESELEAISRALSSVAKRLRAAAVGAYQITCSDETERECIETFHDEFVKEHLPELKFWSRSCFRTANLGGRYEADALGLAEDHFATQPTEASFKLLVVKNNAHVCVADGPDGTTYGIMSRYDRESTCCGALTALLNGADTIYTREIGAAFSHDGVDRRAAILALEPPDRLLRAAIVNALMQGRLAAEEARNHKAHTPTVYLIVSCVTLNRAKKDHEILCGARLIDFRGDEPSEASVGLGDNPTNYQVSKELGQLLVTSG